MNRYKALYVVGVIAISFLVACSAGDTSTPIPPTVDNKALETRIAANIFATQTASAPKATDTVIPTEIPEATTTSIPTDTPIPTETLSPTTSPTPLPTETLSPTAPPTPLPEPIILTGQGDSVIDVKKWAGPAIAKMKHMGSGNFAVTNYSPEGEKIDLLVNTIGAYEGTIPLDFVRNESTGRFEINADGPWSIEILPLLQMRREPIPGKFEGNSDDVIYLDGLNPDLLKAVAGENAGNFAVYAYGTDDRDLVINEIAPYSGTVVLNRDTIVLVIHAGGPWSVEVTTK